MTDALVAHLAYTASDTKLTSHIPYRITGTIDGIVTKFVVQQRRFLRWRDEAAFEYGPGTGVTADQALAEATECMEKLSQTKEAK